MGEVVYLTRPTDDEIRKILKAAGTRLEPNQIALRLATKRIRKGVPNRISRIRALAERIEEELSFERMIHIEGVSYKPRTPELRPGLIERIINKLTRT